MHTYLVAAAALFFAPPPQATPTPTPAPAAIEEMTIAQLHAALQSRSLTCHAVVSHYLERIEAYDKQGPALNTIVSVNPDALEIADSLDARFARTGAAVGPLHCIPLIVKDNIETVQLPTTAGSLSLQGFYAGKDAFVIRRVRKAGAIVLAKSNMAEFALSPFETVSSILPGYTKNPYALDRVTAGSSGGTAAAVSANFGAAGLGTDTGNSIRGPAAHVGLVGIRSTLGLTSRSGVIPLNDSTDVAGPMARTVADAVVVFGVIAGTDSDDPVTADADDHVTEYSAALVRDGLRGARIGILRQAYERPTLDSEVAAVFAQAVADLRAQGATVVDSVPIPELGAVLAIQRESCNRFKYDFDKWIASMEEDLPVESLEDVLRSRRFHPSIQESLENAIRASVPPDSQPGCAQAELVRLELRRVFSAAMDGLHLDAVVYPTWSNPPRLIGDLNTPHGDNSRVFAPLTGWPAIQVPMGYTRETLPAGLTILGRAWSEAALFRFAYAYEQATQHRRAPPTTPALR